MKKKKSFPVLIVVILLLLVLGGFFAVPMLLERYRYSDEPADLGAYFGILDDADVPVILNNEITDIHARVYDGVYYMTFASVQELLNDRFYDGREDGTLIYTTPDAILTSAVSGTHVDSSDGTTKQLPYVISRYEGDTLYVALDYVKQYTDFLYEPHSAPNHMELYLQDEVSPAAVIKKDTKLREKGGVKSPVLESLHKGDIVVILEEMETWTKVKTQNAFIGYVENKRLEAAGEHAVSIPEEAVQFTYPSVYKPYKINLSWHNVAGSAGNETLRDLVSGTKGLTTVSPTWYALSHDDGSFRSYSSAEYVREAHALGLDVWALINDMDYKDTISDYQILSRADNRAALIANLMREAAETGIDGINIDFEYIDEESGESFIQFLRELSIACHERGLVLSVDNYVPKEYNRQYHRAEQGVVCDYVIIMGYDEHGTFSTEAGSVASIDFVTDGITATLEEVPAQKVINAIPFYTRIWTTKDGALSSSAVGMRQAADFVTNHGIALQWDEGTCQNYGEVTEGTTRYQVWMEDADSVRAKLSAMQFHQLAGVASWKLGFDTPEIWDEIADYLQQ